MFKSLRIRLTLLFVILTLIPSVIVAILIGYRGYGTLQNQAVQFQEQIAQQTSIRLEAFFSERQNELHTLIDVVGLGSLDTQTQQDILLTLLADQAAYYELIMTDGDGQEFIRLTRGEFIRTDDLGSRAENTLFQSAIETRSTSFSQVYFNESARDRLITMAVPIEDLFTGEIESVLIAELRFQSVQEAILREINLTEDEDVFIVDSDGIVIAHRNPGLVIRETRFVIPESEGRNAGLSDDDVVLATNTIQLQNLELIVVAETSFENATALAFDLTRLALITTVVTLVIAGIIVIWVVSQVVQPIVKVSKVATAIQGGDLSARADEKGSNEIATLGKAFNSMTAQMQKNLVDLQENVDKLQSATVEREKLIKDLQAAKRLAEENSRLKSEFLSMMSHELRTPMNAIEGFTGIMLNNMAGVEYNDKTERYLTKVQSNSRRLLALINDFLDLSRIESGRLELAYQAMSPADMARKWEESLSVLADNKGLDFTVSVDSDLPEVIYGDEETLSKVAINLLSNAIKFTMEGPVSLKLEKRNGQMALEVQDTGIGIPPHARGFIFDEFRQVDQSSRREFGGTGLGLAIVQKLVREMGGSVSLDSEVGVGSTFTVLLPIQTEKQLV